MLAGDLAGLLLSWQWLALVSAGPALLLLLAVPFLPESPVWLAGRGRHAQAAAALAWLGGTQQSKAEVEPPSEESKAEPDLFRDDICNIHNVERNLSSTVDINYTVL